MWYVVSGFRNRQVERHRASGIMGQRRASHWHHPAVAPPSPTQESKFLLRMHIWENTKTQMADTASPEDRMACKLIRANKHQQEDKEIKYQRSEIMITYNSGHLLILFPKDDIFTVYLGMLYNAPLSHSLSIFPTFTLLPLHPPKKPTKSNSYFHILIGQTPSGQPFKENWAPPPSCQKLSTEELHFSIFINFQASVASFLDCLFRAGEVVQKPSVAPIYCHRYHCKRCFLVHSSGSRTMGTNLAPNRSMDHITTGSTTDHGHQHGLLHLSFMTRASLYLDHSLDSYRNHALHFLVISLIFTSLQGNSP